MRRWLRVHSRSNRTIGDGQILYQKKCVSMGRQYFTCSHIIVCLNLSRNEQADINNHTHTHIHASCRAYLQTKTFLWTIKMDITHILVFLTTHIYITCVSVLCKLQIHFFIQSIPIFVSFNIQILLWFILHYTGVWTQLLIKSINQAQTINKRHFLKQESYK